ncbi:MAG: pyridoxamine 5'-phosphate oxidase family protein [Gemmatimonadota bacterium]|nr:MAG: pyridoxamine 5'-phosphate oxidase family protein [Gemmatimonadota bacterium]
MDEKEAKQLSLGLMASTEAVYVTTIDWDGFPQTRVMFNLRFREQFPSLTEIFEGHEDDLLVYLATNTSSAKINQIKTNPAGCVYYCNVKEFHSLMLPGKFEFVDAPEIKKALWQEGWEIYYPKGPSDPDYTVLRLFPVRAKGWYKDGAFEFSLKDKT